MATNVELNLLTDISQSLKNVEKFTKQTTQQVGKVQQKFNALGDAAKVALGNIAAEGAMKAAEAGFQAITNAISGTIEAAQQEETAVRALNSALKTSGDFSLTASRNLQSFADQMQRTTTVSDEAALELLAQAKAFGVTNEQAQKMTKTAVNVASVTDRDVTQVLDQMGASLTGVAGELEDFIPKLGEMEKSALKNGAAIELMNKKFAGSAQRQINTYRNATAQLNNIWTELLATIGKNFTQNQALQAVFETIRNTLTNMIEAVNNNSQSFREFATTGIKLVVESVEVMIESFAKFGKVTVRVVSETRKILQKLISPIKAVAAGLGALAGGGNPISAMNDSLTDTANNVQAIRNSTQEQVSFFQKLDDSADQFSSNFNKNLQESKTKTQEVERNLSSTTREVQSQTRAQADVKDQQQQTLEVSDKFIERQVKIAELQKEAADQAERQADAQGKSSEQAKANLREKRKGISEQVSKGFGALSQGAGGAKGAVASGAGAAANAIAPGTGKAASAAVKFLGQESDKVKKKIKGIMERVPEIIENIVDNIPVVINTFIEKLPAFIDKLLGKLPQIINSLANKAPKIIEKLVAKVPLLITKINQHLPGIAIQLAAQFSNPKFIGKMVSGMVKGGKKAIEKLIKKLGEGISKIFKKINPFSGDKGGVIGKAVEGVKNVADKINPFQTGGTVPKGFPNDTFPASLSSGEMVVPRSDVQKMRELLKQQEQQNKEIKMREQEGGEGSQQPLKVNLQIGEKRLADVLLNLNKRGFRTA